MLRSHSFPATAAVVTILFAQSSYAQSRTYHFMLKHPPSGLNANLDVSVSTTGTLVGNYDATNNPTGTRTKPGLFGSFGDMENVPVNVALGTALTGHPQTMSSGAFTMTLDPAAGTVSVSGYSSDLLASGPVNLPLTVSLDPDSFRTRNPTSAYIGIPINVPVGDATLSVLMAEQLGQNALGTLQPVGPNAFMITATVPATLTGMLDVLGNPITLPGIPALLPLTGMITLSGDTAALGSSQPIDVSNMAMPGLMLPQFPLDVPTILPPGDTAHLLFDLTLDEISFGLTGTLTTRANGVLVPEPGAGLLLLCAGAVVMSRNRRGRADVRRGQRCT